MGVETYDTIEGGFEAQLAALYSDREKLEREFGISDADDVVSLIRNFESQLASLYKDREGGSSATGGSDPAVGEILSLKSQFSDCGIPEITYEATQGKRTLRAVWKAAA
jgi:hypothetical protein